MMELHTNVVSNVLAILMKMDLYYKTYTFNNKSEKNTTNHQKS